jgi:Cu-processing system ATP-binding protein
MRQRLGLAQALLGEPALLFLDEPTAGLDPESRRGFYTLLDRLRAHGGTIVITSHVLAELQDKVDRIAILREGSVAALGAVADLQRRSGLLLNVQFRAKHSAAPIVQVLRSEGFAPQALPGGEVRLALRASRRMAVLSALAPFLADVEDLRIREPSLEEVFLDVGEAKQ